MYGHGYAMLYLSQVFGMSTKLTIRSTVMPGFSAGDKLRKLGWNASDTRELIMEDVEVPAGPGGLREVAQDAAGLPDPAPPGLAGEQRQGHPEATAGHADLVDGLLLPGQGAGVLPEHTAHTFPQESRRPLVWAARRGHGSSEKGAKDSTPV